MKVKLSITFMVLIETVCAVLNVFTTVFENADDLAAFIK